MPKRFEKYITLKQKKTKNSKNRRKEIQKFPT